MRCQRTKVSGWTFHQGVTPGEQATQNYHHQPSGIIGAVWLHFPLLKQSKLFAQEEVLGSECAARPANEDQEVDEITRYGRQRREAVCQRPEDGVGHEHPAHRKPLAGLGGNQLQTELLCPL